MTVAFHHCPECAEPTAEGWRFCRSCGADLGADGATSVPLPVPLPATEEAAGPSPAVPAETADSTDTAGADTADEGAAGVPGPPDATDERVPWHRAHRTALLRAVVVATAVTVGAAAVWGVRTRGDLADTKDTLATTEAVLSETQEELAGTEDELATRTRERDGARSRLASTEAELAQARTELTGVRESLSDARNRLNLQAGQIETLRICLGGVTDALVYVADFDYASALAALRAVEGACRSANAFV